VRRNEVVRLEGEYCQPLNANFETAFVTVLRRFLFDEYFRDARHVFEFGCGTGLNLVALAEMYPDKVLHGLDWAESSQKILKELSTEKNLGNRLRGYLFDMFSPNMSLDIPPGSALFTIGTMEQLGTDFEAFLQFVLSKKPSVCLHVETMHELYDTENLFDYVATRYLERRNWLRGYLTRLRELESSGAIEIVKCKRTFGSLFHDGYSYLVWRPKNV
jgi:cyclopropane fatty-acyl-phospholipid synthase-like methyltransferase